MENTPKMPELTLEATPAPAFTLENQEVPPAPEPPKEPAPPRDLESTLTDQELTVVTDFAKQINLADSTQILQYGANAQKKISAFSESALANVQSQDMDEIGQMLTGLVLQLKNFDEEDAKGLKGLFKKGSNRVEAMKAKYTTVEKNLDKICGTLEGHKITLLKDITLLDKMYEMNLGYYKELTMYILAGRKKLEMAEARDLPALQEKARQSGKTEDAQAANDLSEQCNRFDKKLYDLELTRNICLQMGPQIRLVQGNDTVMVEKIQSSLVNTIPLWKNQMVLTLGLAHSKSAIDAQRQVSEVTNELLRKNAQTLKTSTIEAAKESERGIVDIETLQITNAALISTLDEVIEIQKTGRGKRREAEGELQRIENELKHKLLEIRDMSQPVAPAPAE